MRFSIDHTATNTKMMQVKRYIAFQCPKCKGWTMQRNTKYSLIASQKRLEVLSRDIKLNCKNDKCQRSTKLWKIDKHGNRIEFAWFDSPLDASDYVRIKKNIR